LDIREIAGVVADMDGVLWRGDEPLPGMAAFFDLLRALGLPFALATNNSSKSPADYVGKLARLGIAGVQESQIVTSGTATVTYLETHYPAGTAVHVLGGDGLKHMITAGGFNLADDAPVVVVGIDFQLTYDKLKRAALLIRGGADFIGTNDDATFPSPDGLVPGAGSLLAALHTATGHAPNVMGKPGAPMFHAALRAVGTPIERTLMIGDRLNTDIMGAQAVGLRTALVLTGVTTRDELAQSSAQPDYVYDGLPALIADLSPP
jgi:4-nitrophenyl phosphatase